MNGKDPSQKPDVLEIEPRKKRFAIEGITAPPSRKFDIVAERTTRTAVPPRRFAIEADRNTRPSLWQRIRRRLGL